jgi:GST-like protein
MAQEPIDLYYWPTPNGHKIRIMLEECGLPYRVKPVDIGKGDQFKPKFLKISPNNKMPAIVDPDGPGGEPISIFESGAILQYLGRKTRKFYPRAERARVAVDAWLFWQVGGLGPMAGQAHHFRVYASEKVAYGIERYTKETTRLYGVFDKRLRGRSFIADDYSIADIAAYPWVLSWEKQGQVLDDFPRIKAWLERISARDAVRRALSSPIK